MGVSDFGEGVRGCGDSGEETRNLLPGIAKGGIVVVSAALMVATGSLPGFAQSVIVPDGTLGAEGSVVIENFNGTPNEVIEGGAQRAQNLFHSFEEFNVDEGRGALFFSPDGIVNIFSRVTGNNPSNILGTLGTFGGDADLFFMNPNGILFGPNASLNVQGSFAAITADAIQFGEEGFFSATDPEVPSELLTVDPSAFFFNQISAGNIVNQSVAPIAPESDFLVGLRVPNNENLLLLGGDVVIDGGVLSTFGGRIDIGAVNSGGIIALDPNGGLSFPEQLQRANITFRDGASASATFRDGGDITLTGQNISLSDNSELRVAIQSGFENIDNQARNIVLNATENIRISESSSIGNTVFSEVSEIGGDIVITSLSLDLLSDSSLSTSTFGEGNAGNIVIYAYNHITINDSLAFSNSNNGASGNGGDIEIVTASLEMLNSSGLQTGALGEGDAGNIIIDASDRISLNNSSAFSFVSSGGISDTGNISIETSILELKDSTGLSTYIFGQGNAGQIRIMADERVTIDDARISSSVQSDAIGSSGAIFISTRDLDMLNASSLSTTTFGEGDAGQIRIMARDRFTLNRARISSLVERNALGDSGDFNIETRTLRLLNGSSIETRSSDADLNAPDEAFRIGDINIKANSVFMNGRSQIRSVLGVSRIGNAGDISISGAEMVTLRDASSLVSSTFGVGNAGNIRIQASDQVIFSGNSLPGIILTPNFDFGALSTVEESAIGEGGDVQIVTGELRMRDGAALSTITLGTGNAGDVVVNATNTVLLDFAGVSSSNELAARGNSGNIGITANELYVNNGSQISTQVFGGGNAGDITLTAEEQILFAGGITISTDTEDTLIPSTAISSVRETGVGNGGNIRITARELQMRDGARLVSSIFGEGNAGNILVDTSDSISFLGIRSISEDAALGGISSSVEGNAIGSGGNITLITEELEVLNGAQIIASLFGEGNAGNIVVRAGDQIRISQDGSAIGNQIAPNAIGDGGNIEIHAENLQLLNGARLSTALLGEGNAGDIWIEASDGIVLRSGEIESTVQADAMGSGGDITITTRTLEVIDGSAIATSTFGESDAGNVTIWAGDRVIFDGISADGTSASSALTTVEADAVGSGGNINITAAALEILNGAFLSARTRGEGNAGNILIVIDDILILDNSDITTQAEAFAGGAINIQAEDIRLFGDADITTFVNSGAAGGGNITLAADSIIAFDDSDILAFSADGQGGNVTLDTPAFFGENFNPVSLNADPTGLDNNDRVDINATGAVSGTVLLPDVSFIQNSLNDLPESLISTEELIANSCVVQNEDGSSTFVITGPGGLPERPGDAVSDYPTGEVQTIPDESSQHDNTWQIGDPIIEPQGVYQLPNGEMVLSHTCR